MGQTLSTPVTDKYTQSGSNSKYAFSSSEMQGWRVSMEDAHTNLLSLPGDPDAAFFGVYDGHGGHAVAKYISEHIHKNLVGDASYGKEAYDEALSNVFRNLDDEMRTMLRNDQSGAACNVLLLKANRVYCANAGDSRAIMCTRGTNVELSFDHKPTNELEKIRILEAGGTVEAGRVNGNLALSRALGDFEFKMNKSQPVEKQVVTCVPDVIEKEINDDVDFFVCCCDGIWDVMTNQQVTDFIYSHIIAKKPLTEISEQLCNACLSTDMTNNLGCDNMTVIIVAHLQGRTYEEFCVDIEEKAMGWNL